MVSVDSDMKFFKREGAAMADIETKHKTAAAPWISSLFFRKQRHRAAMARTPERRLARELLQIRSDTAKANASVLRPRTERDSAVNVAHSSTGEIRAMAKPN